MNGIEINTKFVKGAGEHYLVPPDVRVKEIIGIKIARRVKLEALWDMVDFYRLRSLIELFPFTITLYNPENKVVDKKVFKTPEDFPATTLKSDKSTKDIEYFFVKYE